MSYHHQQIDVLTYQLEFHPQQQPDCCAARAESTCAACKAVRVSVSLSMHLSQQPFSLQHGNMAAYLPV